MKYRAWDKRQHRYLTVLIDEHQLRNWFAGGWYKDYILEIELNAR